MARRTSGSLAIALAAAALAASCGGGIGGSGSPMSGGGSGSADAKGSITRFGSIFVGGVEFDIAGAGIFVNGAPATEADLRPGMVVRVEGTRGADPLAGTARRVAYDCRLVGVVDAYDEAAGRVDVLGQTVLRDAFTTWYDPGSDTLSVGNVLEVGGFVDSGGAIRATYLMKRHPVFVPGSSELELLGDVSGLDAAAGTFRIGGLTVDYRAAALAGLPASGLSDGDEVRVRSTAAVAGGIWQAERVEGTESFAGGPDGGWGALEGAVENTDTAGFSLDGQAVTTGPETRYEEGTAADLVAGARVAVQGAWAGGALSARTVRFVDRAPLLYGADVEAVDAASGTVALLGKAFRVDAFSRLRDTRNESGHPFLLGDLRAGDRVEIRAAAGADPVAAQVVRTNPSLGTVLEGPLESVAGDTLVVGGVLVRLDTRSAVVGKVGGIVFLDGRVGSTVRIEGRWDGQAIVADTVTVLP
jgi:hypothetical protein